MYDLLILYSNRVLSLSVPAMTVILGHSQETKPGYLPCFCGYLHLRGQTGGKLYMSGLKPIFFSPQEM